MSAIEHLAVRAALVGLVGLAGLGSRGDAQSPLTEHESSTDAAELVEVVMDEYSFTVSGPLVAGGTISVRNAGTELHEIGLARLREGTTMDDLRDAITSTTGGEDPLAPLYENEVGLPGGIFGPGQAVDVTLPDLGPGRYALVCFLPGEGDGVHHAAKGMIGLLDVEAGQAPQPSADATYTIVPGAAIEGPTELEAGRHVLEVAAEPGAEGLEPTLIRLDPGVSADEFFAAVDTAFGNEEGPPEGSALGLPGDIIGLFHDFGSTSTFYVGVDLEPGTYELMAADSDADPSGEDGSPQGHISIVVTESP